MPNENDHAPQSQIGRLREGRKSLRHRAERLVERSKLLRLLGALVTWVVVAALFFSGPAAWTRQVGFLGASLTLAGHLVEFFGGRRWAGTKLWSRMWLPLAVVLFCVLAMAVVLMLIPVCTAKPVGGSVRSFPVDNYYVASGVMGDVEDVSIAFGPGVRRFTYQMTGKGGHEWDYKCVGGKVNPTPARFGGVMWLSPANASGTACDGGYDLRGFRRIVWEARSTGAPANVEFVMGGVTWFWKMDPLGNCTQVRAPYPDTMPQVSLGIRQLTEEWQTFDFSLAAQSEQNLKRVVGGFGWVANAGSGPGRIEFEVRNIRYEREAAQ